MFKNIIVNLPSNIGDTILTLPALNRLHLNYPQAKLTLICSKQTQEFLSHYSDANETLLFDKRWPAMRKFKFSLSLRQKYDLIVDFKNSLLPLFTGAKRTPFFRKFTKNLPAKDRYLYLIKDIAPIDAKKTAQFLLTEDEEKKWKLPQIEQSVFVACASNALQKRYPYNLLKELVKNLAKRTPVTILGQEADRQFYKDILNIPGVNDLVGKTKIHEVFYLLTAYARLLVCVDSSIMHIASYLDIPIVAMFGQTSVLKYGPWSKKYIVVKRDDLDCVPCENPHCRFNHECMEIDPKRVLSAIDKLNPNNHGTNT
ncbi:MAG: glycosyltransferase family 9 protein [Candidatus Omnitrophica bacterium]|jgi:ADP-heptose:LPS heptosyltransferase|nr:glycosyltransferase family 9 protein [Candidatus Omnitrophota bacterium]